MASELFAESRDAWLTLGILPDNESSKETADGAPATRAAARARLARMMLLDPEGYTDGDAAVASEWIASRQATQIARAARRVAKRVGWIPEAVVVSGHANELVSRSLAATGWDVRRIAIADWIGPDGARVAPAWAVALLAAGMIP